MTEAATMSRRGLALVALLGLAVLLTYVDRGAIGIAAPLMIGDLGLSATGFGIAVSAFFWIYVPACLAAGWLCERFSVYATLSFGVLLWALATLLTGLVGGLALLVLLRLALGAGESVVFPAASKLIASEIAPAQRGMANSIVAAGIAFGPAVGTFAGGLLLAGYGWRAMFVVFGLATLLWLAPWHRLARTARATVAADDGTPAVSLLALSRLPTLWLVGIGQFMTNYGFYFLVAWMPLYLVKERGYSIAEMTLATTLGFIVQGVFALLGGWASDRLVRGGADEGALRKRLLAAGQVAMAAAIAGIFFASSLLAIAGWLALAGFGAALLSTNVFALGQMFAGPRAAGGWIGIQNAIANVSGIVGPVLTGVIVDRLDGYGWAFAVSAAVALAGAGWWLAVVPPVREVRVAGRA